MALVDVYPRLKPSIVAFCAKYSDDPRYGNRGWFPSIIGTGFIVDSCGLILTNQHVVDAFRTLKAPSTDTCPLNRVCAVIFDVHDNEVRYPGLELTGATVIKSHKPADDFFDREPPDLALVGVNVNGLPAAELDRCPTAIKEGLEVGTAGFPMGTLLLTNQADGTLKRLSPTLQRGVIAAIQPWAVDEPVTFTVNVLVQGGASGSPVFDTNTGLVIGVISARQYEPDLVGLFHADGRPAQDERGNQLKTQVLLPTNFSVVVPVYRIADKIGHLKEEMLNQLGNSQISLQELYARGQAVDFARGARAKSG